MARPVVPLCHYRCNTMSAHSGTRESPALYWTGVLNNYTEDELNALSQLDCPELVIDREVGEEGTPHLHIYLKLTTKKRLAYLKTLAPRAHWEHVRNRAECIRYCTKGEVVVERLIGPANKTRLGHSIEILRSQGVAGVAREMPEAYVLHYRGFQALELLQLD